MNNKSCADVLRESFILARLGFNDGEVYSIIIEKKIKIIESKKDSVFKLINAGYTLKLRAQGKEIYEIK